MPTVLAVDDDPIVLQLIRLSLVLEGYVVLTAASSTDAVALRADHEIDALVTDVRLPDLDGIELARRLRITDPELPVVFVSGEYWIEPEVYDHRFLPKPFSPRRLVEEVAAALKPSRPVSAGPRIHDAQVD